jgi:hypothetical protein
LLRCGSRSGPRGLESLIENALVTRMHVYEYESLLILRKDIDAMKLSESHAEGAL